MDRTIFFIKLFYVRPWLFDVKLPHEHQLPAGFPFNCVNESLFDNQPRKILLEQLSRCMPADDALPDHVILVSGSDLQGCNLAGRLAERQQRVLNTIGAADVRATIGYLASKIQKL